MMARTQRALDIYRKLCIAERRVQELTRDLHKILPVSHADFEEYHRITAEWDTTYAELRK